MGDQIGVFDGQSETLSELLYEFYVGFVEMLTRFSGYQRNDSQDTVSCDDRGNHRGAKAERLQKHEMILVLGRLSQHLLGHLSHEYRLTSGDGLCCRTTRSTIGRVLALDLAGQLQHLRVPMGQYRLLELSAVEELDAAPVGEALHQHEGGLLKQL